jgi:hypothetical protein
MAETLVEVPNCPPKNKTDPKGQLKYKQKFPAKLSSLNKASRMWSRMGFELPTTCFPASSLNH